MIDFHTHCYPDQLAARALYSWPDPAVGTGTVEDLTSCLIGDGFDLAVCLHVAVLPRSQRATNEFAQAVNHGRLISFGSVHPDAPDALDALDELKAAGICGVKFHPTQQRFSFADARYFPLYRRIGALGLITLVHAGGVPELPDFICGPREVSRAIDAFHGSPFVMAHMGGQLLKQDELDIMCRLPVYHDTAYCAEVTQQPRFEEILRRCGTDRVLLGSDYPWSTPKTALDFLQSFPLTEGELHAICQGNAELLLRSAGAWRDA